MIIIRCEDKYIPKVIIDVDRCVGCYMCQRACALAKCISINSITNVAEVIEPADCTGCMACERACPYDCISVINYVEPSIRAKLVISRVKRYMRSPIITVNGDQLIREGAKIMVKYNIASLILQEENKIVTETDILTSPNLNMRLKDIGKDVICVDKLCGIEKALEVMLYYGISHLPITCDDKIVGMISFRDVLRAYTRSEIIKDSSHTYVKIDLKTKLREIGERVNVIEGEITLRDAINLMIREKRKALVLKKHNKIGIFTFRDAIRMIAEGKTFDDLIEGRFDIKIFNSDDNITSLIPWIIEKNNRHVIAVDNENVFLISVKDMAGRTIWIQIKH
jgi:CBS domain-containing protein/NAD-dependent dihydropyrimidine dehydrogenase PreA subunit